MKKIDLIKVEHDTKIGDVCPYKEPNITEDCIFYENGVSVGFYIKKMPDRLCKIADLCNSEFKSKNVPKTLMQRPKMLGIDENGKGIIDRSVSQMSSILGGVPPKPHMRRDYPTISSVHSVKSAQTFIKAMLLLAKESEKFVKEILPEQYEKQLKIFENVNSKYKFGNLFTSSISNYNISAPFHRDTANIENCINVIITKKKLCKNGDLHVPDYDLTMNSADNSMLVYPAWKNVHGVTPIIPFTEDSYRNSLIFYPLKAFLNLID